MGDLLELDGELVEALLEADRNRWGMVEELLARIVELLDRDFRLQWSYVHRYAKTKPMPPQPITVKRPGETTMTGRTVPFRALEDAMRARQEA